MEEKKLSNHILAKEKRYVALTHRYGYRIINKSDFLNFTEFVFLSLCYNHTGVQAC